MSLWDKMKRAAVSTGYALIDAVAVEVGGYIAITYYGASYDTMAEDPILSVFFPAAAISLCAFGAYSSYKAGQHIQTQNALAEEIRHTGDLTGSTLIDIVPKHRTALFHSHFVPMLTSAVTGFVLYRAVIPANTINIILDQLLMSIVAAGCTAATVIWESPAMRGTASKKEERREHPDDPLSWYHIESGKYAKVLYPLSCTLKVGAIDGAPIIKTFTTAAFTWEMTVSTQGKVERIELLDVWASRVGSILAAINVALVLGCPPTLFLRRKVSWGIPYTGRNAKLAAETGTYGGYILISLGGFTFLSLKFSGQNDAANSPTLGGWLWLIIPISVVLGLAIAFANRGIRELQRLAVKQHRARKYRDGDVELLLMRDRENSAVSLASPQETGNAEQPTRNNVVSSNRYLGKSWGSLKEEPPPKAIVIESDEVMEDEATHHAQQL